MEKTADRPHRVAIVLSVAALLISLFSLWESHETRLLNTVTSGAMVQVTALSADKLIQSDEDSFPVPITMVLTNLGKAPATGLEIDCNTERDIAKIKYNGFQGGCYGKLQPLGQSYSYPQHFVIQVSQRMSSGGPNKTSPVYVFGIVKYEDNATGKDHEERWCYQASLNSAGDIRPSTFVPCADTRIN